MISSSGNAKDATSFTDGLHPTHHSSSHLPVNSLSRNSLSVSSDTKIPSKSSCTSTIIPSSSLEPDVSPNKIVPTRSASTELLPALERRSPSRPNKRKRDSELRGMGGSHLRDAQDKVDKKRAKIAARVPSAMVPGSATPTATAITSLADLYAQLRRDSSASDQQAALNVLPTPKITPKIVSGNGRHQDHRLQGTPRGHSSGSSPDPIAMSENDQEIVVLKHVRPSSPQVRTHLGPTTRVGPPTHLKLLSKAKSSTLTPNGSTAKRVGNSSDKPHKSKPTFAIVITSPLKRAPQKPAHVEKHTHPGPDVPQSAQAGTPVTPPADTLREITNGKTLKPLTLHTPSPAPPAAPAPPVRAVEATTDSVPELGLRRSRRAPGPHVDSPLTPRDIDVLLGATPLPFDFSLPHIHRTSCGKGKDDSGGEECSLWWYHPIFEARAKADIRRTLRALLPADPAQDPPLPIGGGTVGWRAEVRPRQSRARMWAERLEDAFGPGPLNRGLGRKPRRVARPAGAARRAGSENGHSRRAAPRPVTVVIANSHKRAHRSIDPPSQLRSLKDAAVALIDTDVDMVEDVREGEAAAWTAALLPLVKGKTTMDEIKMAHTSDALCEVERANKRGVIPPGVLKESALADTVRRLGELEDVPLGDVYGLRKRARTLAERWREMFGDEVVDLQRSHFLHAS